MKISLIHGICVRYDAISNAIADQFLWLRGAGHDVRLYAYDCDRPELQCHIVTTLHDVAFDPHFQHSDVVLFHFGITYPLFDLLLVAPQRARRLVAFHNITPKQFVPQAAHAVIERSLRQMANIAFASLVVCDSETNLQVLRAARIGTAATVLPLAVASPPQPPARKPSAGDGIVRVAFIGRLVASKGPQDLLTAMRAVLDSHPSVQLQLDVVAGLAFSEPSVVDAVRAASREWPQAFGQRAALHLHGNAPEELKMRLLSDADLFILPTRHEGFCVPIVEALAHGCQVIAYANSNTPAISGGHATLVKTGDVDALGQALTQHATQTAAPAWRDGAYATHARQTWQYAQQFAPELVRERFLALIAPSTP